MKTVPVFLCGLYFFLALVLLSFASQATATPIIGVAKQTTIDRNQVTLDFYLENLGDEELTNLSMPDNLDAVFGAGNYEIATPPTLVTNPSTVDVNPLFNGSADIELLSSESFLGVTEIAHIRLLVNLLTFSDQGQGTGLYRNQVTVSALGIGEVESTDLSDSGTEPDPDGDNNPDEPGENDPTWIDFTPAPIIGAAKNVTLNGLTVTFDYYLHNLGTVDHSNITLPDDLDAVFGAGNYSITTGPTLIDDPGTLTVNGGYNGSGDTALITAGNLAIDDTAQIRIMLNVTGSGVYSNQVTATATGLGVNTYSDLSDNGILPDPNGDGNPRGEFEDDPTTFALGQEPQIGVAKTATPDGNEVIFDLYLENLGNVDLTNIRLLDELDSVFGADNYFVNSAPTLKQGPATIIPNLDFNGSADIDLISSGSLLQGETAQVQVVLSVVLSDRGAGLGVYHNQVLAGGEAPGGGQTYDYSDDGVDPDPNGNNDPTESGEDDPTVFTIPINGVIGVAKTAYRTGGATDNPAVTFMFFLENLGNVTINQLSMPDDLDVVFGAGNYLVTAKANDGILSVNTGFNGNTDSELLAPGNELVPGDQAHISVVVVLISVTDQGDGVGMYHNQVTLTGKAPDNSDASDLSDKGTIPDPNDNGLPNDADEDDPTLFSVYNYLGIAKNATINGKEITLDFYLENFSTDQALNELAIEDELDNVFGEGAYLISSGLSLVDDPGTITLNPDFDGTTDTVLMAENSSLAIGDTAQIQLTIALNEVTNQGFGTGIYYNQVSGSASTIMGIEVYDLSVDGTDPDPDSNDDPVEGSATIIILPSTALVGAAKTATVNGSEVTFDYYLESFGSETSLNLSLIEDLDTVFGVGNYTISSSPSLIDDPGTIIVNGAFDGSGDTELFGSGSTLSFGDTAQIRIIVDVTSITDQGNGVGIYSNQVKVSGDDAAGLTFTDLSDQGTDPDTNGDGDPGTLNPEYASIDENTPTHFFIGTSAIGAAKNVTVNDTDVTVDIYLKNLGDVPLTFNTPTLPDYLFQVFGIGKYTVSTLPLLLVDPGTITVNSNFNGYFSPYLILAGSLEPGAKAVIRFVVNVTAGNGTYSNQVEVTATDLTGAAVTDLSDAGVLVDADNNGDAGDLGEDDPTPIIIGENAVIGAAKQADVSGQDVTFTLYLENIGDTELSNLSLQEDLDAVFGAGNYTLTGSPNTTGSTITLNTNFDGSSDTELLADGSTLVDGATAQVVINLTVNTITDQGLGMGVYENQVSAQADGAGGSITSDRSDDGNDPDPNGNGFPNDVDEDDPTRFTLAKLLIGAAKDVTVDGNVVTFSIVVENMGTTELTSISINEDLDEVFGSGNYILGDVNARTMVLNSGFDGSGNTALIDNGVLSAGASDEITIQVTVTTLADMGGGLGVYANQVMVYGTTDTVTVDDLSDFGADPDPNGNGLPNDADEGDPTTFILQQPVVSTQAVSQVAISLATGNGTLSNFGTDTPSAHGMVWNTSGAPTLADSYSDEGIPAGTGTFTSTITGLDPDTTYHVRAYATSRVGTSYGAETTFKTPAEDGDGVDFFEESGPNGDNYDYDGNGDGIADNIQGHVVSLYSAKRNGYFTLIAAPANLQLINVKAHLNTAPTIPTGDIYFPYDFFGYDISGMSAGGLASITFMGVSFRNFENFWQHMPAPPDFPPELDPSLWYEFFFNGTTGTVVNDSHIEVFYQDGELGDDDISFNSYITVDQTGSAVTRSVILEPIIWLLLKDQP